jgi:quinol monooxygenase YgiN
MAGILPPTRKVVKPRIIVGATRVLVVATQRVPDGPSSRLMRNTPFVRMAEIEVDPAQREAFVSVVKEEMDESVRVEPGVLALFAVAELDNPSRLRFFEIYTSQEAYQAHLASPHFMKYRSATESMIRSRVLTETIPIQSSSKADW